MTMLRTNAFSERRQKTQISEIDEIIYCPLFCYTPLKHESVEGSRPPNEQLEEDESSQGAYINF